MSPSAPIRRPTAASRTLAEQLQPIVEIHKVVRDLTYAHVDVTTARIRINSGRTAFEVSPVLHAARDLTSALDRTASAFEHTGIASTPGVALVTNTKRTLVCWRIDLLVERTLTAGLDEAAEQRGLRV